MQKKKTVGMPQNRGRKEVTPQGAKKGARKPFKVPPGGKT